MYLDGLNNGGGGMSFYRPPLQGSPQKYGNQLVGVNKLKLMVKVTCKKAGLQGITVTIPENALAQHNYTWQE